MLTTSHANHTTAFTRLGDEREALDAKEASLRKAVEEAEDKRAWFKSFKDWVESLADFLDAKVCLEQTIILASIWSCLDVRFGLLVSPPREARGGARVSDRGTLRHSPKATGRR